MMWPVYKISIVRMSSIEHLYILQIAQRPGMISVNIYFDSVLQLHPIHKKKNGKIN